MPMRMSEFADKKSTKNEDMEQPFEYFFKLQTDNVDNNVNVFSIL